MTLAACRCRRRCNCVTAADPDLAALYEPMLARETNRRARDAARDRRRHDRTVTHRRRAGGRPAAPRDRSRRDRPCWQRFSAAADRIRYLTPQLHAEMVSELRWPGDPCPDTGIDVLSLELDPGDLAVLDILKRPDVMAYLAQWNAGAALGEDTRRRVLASSALAVISVAGRNLDRLCARRICR